MIFASPTPDIEQAKPVTTTFPAEDAHEAPVEVAHEEDQLPAQRRRARAD